MMPFWKDAAVRAEDGTMITVGRLLERRNAATHAMVINGAGPEQTSALAREVPESVTMIATVDTTREDHSDTRSQQVPTIEASQRSSLMDVEQGTCLLLIDADGTVVARQSLDEDDLESLRKAASHLVKRHATGHQSPLLEQSPKSKAEECSELQLSQRHQSTSTSSTAADKTGDVSTKLDPAAFRAFATFSCGPGGFCF